MTLFFRLRHRADFNPETFSDLLQQLTHFVHFSPARLRVIFGAQPDVLKVDVLGIRVNHRRHQRAIGREMIGKVAIELLQQCIAVPLGALAQQIAGALLHPIGQRRRRRRRQHQPPAMRFDLAQRSGTPRPIDLAAQHRQRRLLAFGLAARSPSAPAFVPTRRASPRARPAA